MRPVQLRPHPLYLPRPGQSAQRYSQIAGWHQSPGAEYIVGIRPAPKEEPVTEQDVAAWRGRWEATCSDKIALLLCQLERDYGTSA